MKNPRRVSGIGAIPIMCGITFFGIATVFAQEAMKGKEEKAGMQGKMADMRAEIQKMREQMQAMHQEMMRGMREQVTALREHTRTMEGITNKKHLLMEMKKHMQMTDEFLETMLEQREKMHARMKEHRRQMRERMKKKMEGRGTEQEEKPEAPQ